MSVLAVDVGGTKTLVGLVNGNGEVLCEHEFPTRLGGDDVQAVVSGVGALLTQWRAVPERAGAGFPEYVNGEGEVTSAEVLSWSRQPKALLTEVLTQAGAKSPSVRIESDVRLGAWGELRFGAGTGLDSFVYVSLGTGLSSAFVAAGRPWRGARGEAIALGEWPSPGEGMNLEAFASGAGVQHRYSTLTGKIMTARQIVAAASNGDDAAMDVLATAGFAIGGACAQLVSVLDPAAVILGGGLGSAQSLLGRTLQGAYESAAGRPNHPPLITAALGHRAGLLGAAALALT